MIPVLLPRAKRGERSDLPPLLLTSTWVEFRETLNDEEKLAELVRGIRNDRSDPKIRGQNYKGECPYRGLNVFDVEHAPVFFGREGLTGWLLSDLRESRTRFLAIVGPSGSGKSSLARAGLTAAIKKGEIKGSELWPRSIVRPGPNPLGALAAEICPDGVDVYTQANRLLADRTTLHVSIVATLKGHPGAGAHFLLVDQFEEIFTQCTDEGRRRAFMNCLVCTRQLRIQREIRTHQFATGEGVLVLRSGSAI
jgi:hypothetical protein